MRAQAVRYVAACFAAIFASSYAAFALLNEQGPAWFYDNRLWRHSCLHLKKFSQLGRFSSGLVSRVTSIGIGLLDARSSRYVCLLVFHWRGPLGSAGTIFPSMRGGGKVTGVTFGGGSSVVSTQSFLSECSSRLSGWPRLRSGDRLRKRQTERPQRVGSEQ